MAGRSLTLSIADLGLCWSFTTNGDGSRIVKGTGPAGATIRGDSIALLQIAARRVEPDTLFFQRRLMVEGDTELGLQARNLLDALEDEDLPPALARFRDHAARVAERLP